MTLNPRQQKFAELYAASGNAKRAYLEAGYTTKDDNSAESAASRLLRNVKVNAEVEAIRAQAAEDAGITVAEVVKRLDKIYDLGVAKAKNLGAAATAAHLLGKHLGMFEERTRDMTPDADVEPEPDVDSWAKSYGRNGSSGRSPGLKPH